MMQALKEAFYNEVCRVAAIRLRDELWNRGLSAHTFVGWESNDVWPDKVKRLFVPIGVRDFDDPLWDSLIDQVAIVIATKVEASGGIERCWTSTRKGSFLFTCGAELALRLDIDGNRQGMFVFAFTPGRKDQHDQPAQA